MKKNVFANNVKEELLQRAGLLNESAEAKWGVMNAAEMLRHLSEVLKATRTRPASGKPTSFKQAVSRFLILNVVPAIPKGAKAPATLDIKLNKITGLQFDEEVKTFKEELNMFCSTTNEIAASHPYFGNMSRKQWGIMTWMHLDHHLRQFGV